VRTALGDPADLVAVARALPLEIELTGLTLVPHGDRAVLARAVVPSAPLLDLHAGVAAAVAEWGAALPHTVPGDWTPHVTLARRLRVDDLARAISAVDAGPLSARATALRIWDAAERRVLDVPGP
jgi:2'-5' RNA ligase